MMARAGDTLDLPIRKGIIKYDATDSAVSLDHPIGIMIAATTDFDVRSTAKGIIIGAYPTNEHKWVVIIKGDDGLYYDYGQLDFVQVKKGQPLGRGAKIGRLNESDREGRTLFFAVMRGDRFLKAENYVSH